MTAIARNRDLRALGGVLFMVFFAASLFVPDILAPSTAPIPLPGTPAAEVARYYSDNQANALIGASLQGLSAISLLVFVPRVAELLWRSSNQKDALHGAASIGGFLAGAALLLSALFSVALVAAGAGLDLVGALRSLNFLFGGTIHVALLGMFVGAASISASRSRAIPRWIRWLGMLAAMVSVLSLVSLALYPASVLIPLGRLLGAIWAVAVGISLLSGRPRPGPSKVQETVG